MSSSQDVSAPLFASAARTPDAPALILGEQTITYGQLASDVQTRATALVRRGVGRGDHVGLVGGNTYAWIVSYLAIGRAAAVSILLSSRWTSAELSHALVTTRVRHLLYEPTIRGKDFTPTLHDVLHGNDGARVAGLGLDLWAVEDLSGAEGEDLALVERTIITRLEELTPATIASMVFTSGSTGFPKAAMLRHSGIRQNALDYTTRLGMTSADRWCSAMPFFHVGGHIWGLMGCLTQGACLVALDRFDPRRCLQEIQDRRATIYFAVATMVHDVLRVPTFDDFDLSSLRICSAGADPELRREVRRRFKVPTILSMYGMTETHGNLTLTGPDDPEWVQDTTFGRGYRSSEIVAADPETGQVLESGVDGELLVRGPCVFAGYFDDAAATARAVDADGWLHTGDLGSIGTDGYLRYAGRRGERIRVGGENVSLEEIERVIAGHPAVEQAYAVGIPDARLEEVPVVFVRPRPGEVLGEPELSAHCAGQLASFKRPRAIFVVAEFPTGSSGRASKAQLRELAVAALSAGGAQ